MGGKDQAQIETTTSVASVAHVASVAGALQGSLD